MKNKGFFLKTYLKITKELASIGQSKNTEMENWDDGTTFSRRKVIYHMKEKLGAIARTHYNISKVTIPKKMKNTHKKLFLLEKLFTHITLTKKLLYLFKQYIL